MEGDEDVLVERHVRYFAVCCRGLPHQYTSMDTNRLTVLHFAVHALKLLGALDRIEVAPVVEWIYSLQVVPGARAAAGEAPPAPDGQPDARGEDRGRQDGPGGACGGFRGGSFLGPSAPLAYRSGHIAMTYCALLTLRALGDDLGRVDRAALLEMLRAMQEEDGSFRAVVAPSEADMRFLYCACTISHILGDWSAVDRDRAVDFIRRSRGFDGGFGLHPMQESHGGATYCAVASLVLMGRLGDVLAEGEPREQLEEWCRRRQSRGFNGRANKSEDTCYSFWVGATLRLLGVDGDLSHGLTWQFNRNCQSKRFGGFGKEPGVPPDVLHSYYGVCQLSLSGRACVQDLDPLYGVPLLR